MTAIDLMADRLDQELQARGIFTIGRSDCAKIIRAVIDHAAEVAENTSAKPREVERTR